MSFILQWIGAKGVALLLHSLAMEAIPSPTGVPTPDTEKIKQRLIRKGVQPTPKIIHALRKKQLQKSIRKSKALEKQGRPPTEDEKVEEEAYFQTIKREYRESSKALMVGKPWERPGFKEVLNASVEYSGERLKREHLRELGEILEKRGEVRWLLDDDVEVEQGSSGGERREWNPSRRRRSDAEAIRFLVDRYLLLVLLRKFGKMKENKFFSILPGLFCLSFDEAVNN